MKLNGKTRKDGLLVGWLVGFAQGWRGPYHVVKIGTKFHRVRQFPLLSSAEMCGLYCQHRTRG